MSSLFTFRAIPSKPATQHLQAKDVLFVDTVDRDWKVRTRQGEFIVDSDDEKALKTYLVDNGFVDLRGAALTHPKKTVAMVGYGSGVDIHLEGETEPSRVFGLAGDTMKQAAAKCGLKEIGPDGFVRENAVIALAGKKALTLAGAIEMNDEALAEFQDKAKNWLSTKTGGFVVNPDAVNGISHYKLIFSDSNPLLSPEHAPKQPLDILTDELDDRGRSRLFGLPSQAVAEKTSVALYQVDSVMVDGEPGLRFKNGSVMFLPLADADRALAVAKEVQRKRELPEIPSVPEMRSSGGVETAMGRQR